MFHWDFAPKTESRQIPVLKNGREVEFPTWEWSLQNVRGSNPTGRQFSAGDRFSCPMWVGNSWLVLPEVALDDFGSIHANRQLFRVDPKTAQFLVSETQICNVS